MKKLNRFKITDCRLLIILICTLLFSVFNFLSAQSLSADAGNNTSVCENDSVAIGGNPSATGGTPPYSYSWSPASALDNTTIANPNAFPGTTTNFTLTVTDGASNTAQSVISILVLPAPTIDAGPDQNILEGTSTVLQASMAANYLWFPQTGLNDPTLATPTAEPGATTTYCVATQDFNGCTNFDCMTLELTPNNSVIIYNAFTPNADGVNDVLYIGNIMKFPENKIEVFNRNGKIVYQASPYKNDWDGKVEGADLPCATYYVVFTLGYGFGKAEKSVTIIR